MADSVELANELFSAVTEGESGNEKDRQGALARLGQFLKLYSDPELGDEESCQLIARAISLLNSAGSAGSDESGEGADA